MVSVAAGIRVAPVFLLQFSKKGMFVHFPFHPASPGLLSRGTVQPDSTQMDLRPEGAVTSHRVKYSHHLDGSAHFSQDGRIRTKVRNEAQPLTGQAPHLFSVDVQGLDHLARPYDEWDRLRVKYGDTYFEFQQEQFPDSVHVVARWIRVNEVDALATVRNPVTILGGREREAAACAPPVGSDLHGGVLLFEASARDPVEGDGDFLLLFVGGFDETAGDASQPGSALVLIYPTQPDRELPNIDWTPS